MADKRNFLLSGRNAAGTGLVARLRLLDTTPRQVLVLEERTFPNLQPARIFWNSLEQRLYLLDAAEKRILHAPWNAADPIPQENAFAVAVDAQSMGMLGDPADSPWRILLEAPMPVLQPGVFVRRDMKPTVLMPTRLYHDGTQWRAEHASPLTPPEGPPRWRVDEPLEIRSVGPVRVYGPLGNFSVANVDLGETVATGVVDVAWQPVDVTPAEEMVPGHRHRVVGPEAPDGTVFHPSVRYGAPLTAGVLKAFRGLMFNPQLHRGSQTHTPGFLVRRTPPPAATEMLDLFLWVNARGVDGSDPVTVEGDLALLTPLFQLEGEAPVSPEVPGIPAGIRLPIPDDPDLEGVVLLFQMVAVAPNEDAVVSDVFGSTVLVPPGGGGGGGGMGAEWLELLRQDRVRSRVWRRMEAEERAAALASVRQWGENRGLLVTPEQADKIRELQERLKRQAAR